MTNLALKRFILKTLKLRDYKTDYRLMTRFPRYLHYTLIGLLLSDGGLEKPTITSSVRLSVVMSTNNYPYILHLYNLFEPYINTDLSIFDINVKNSLNKKNKKYSTVRFKSISMPQLIYFYNLFYTKNVINGKWEKRVPLELKFNFNAVSLAHLLMGDGNYLSERNIIRIYTNSFKKEDVILLSNIINENLNIKNKVVHDRRDQYIIIIEKDDVSLTREVTLPFMHPSMYYKLGINQNLITVNRFNYFNIINDI